VLEVEAMGRLMVRELVVVAMLKMLPAVPVAIEAMTPAPREMEVEVPTKTFCPPVMERPEPTVREPRVVVPIPPLDTAKGLVRVREVKAGVAETAMVEVPERTMLAPALKKEMGEL
jgi:hypothetical protein